MLILSLLLLLSLLLVFLYLYVSASCYGKCTLKYSKQLYTTYSLVLSRLFCVSFFSYFLFEEDDTK